MNNVQCSESGIPISPDGPITIIINKPTHEYAHGRHFRKDPTWIVVHYTACINVSAKSMCRAMRKNKGASSHFYIDEKDICQAVPLKYVAWHVGNGKCKQTEDKKSLQELSNYIAKDWRYDLAASNHLKWKEQGSDFLGNSQSIGVDLCVKKKSKRTKSAVDKDWYFESGAMENTAKTVAYLANKYNISLDHIIRHGDATGKLCPRPFISIPSDDSGDKKWEEFKLKVKEYIERSVEAQFK